MVQENRFYIGYLYIYIKCKLEKLAKHGSPNRIAFLMFCEIY